MTPHTPSPWKVVRQSPESPVAIADGKGRAIALPLRGVRMTDEEMLANAAIMTAAPEFARELAAVLLDLDKWLRQNPGNFDDVKKDMLLREDSIQKLLRKGGFGQ